MSCHTWTYKKTNLKRKDITADRIGPMDIVLRDGEYYSFIGCDIPFRLRVNPFDSGKTFTNRKDLLMYLETYQPENQIMYFDEYTNDFVKGYTVELVEKINEFFNKYGDDNIWIEFG